MKKMILIGFMVLFMVSGCSSSAYETYVEAMEKTESVDRYQSLLEIEVDMSFDKELMDEKEYEEFKKFEKTRLSMEFTMDNTKDQSMAKVQGSIFDKGVQGKIYQDQQEVIMVSPLFPKILVVQSDELKGEYSYQEEKFSKETYRQLNTLWKETITQDKVSSIGNVVISTPEGEIKAKEYHMNLREEDMKPLLKQSLDILLKDDYFKELLLKDAPKDLDVEDEFMKLLEHSTIKEIKQYAFIDRDNYIPEESFTMSMEIQEEDMVLRSFDISINTQNWNFNKEVPMERPDIHPDNIMYLEELLEGEAWINQ